MKTWSLYGLSWRIVSSCPFHRANLHSTFCFPQRFVPTYCLIRFALVKQHCSCRSAIGCLSLKHFSPAYDLLPTVRYHHFSYPRSTLCWNLLQPSLDHLKLSVLPRISHLYRYLASNLCLTLSPYFGLSGLFLHCFCLARQCLQLAYQICHQLCQLSLSCPHPYPPSILFRPWSILHYQCSFWCQIRPYYLQSQAIQTSLQRSQFLSCLWILACPISTQNRYCSCLRFRVAFSSHPVPWHSIFLRSSDSSADQP
mmetsp:Transcript_16561/g.55252  ORF Transcript_16561/g.55252 Transcript_16561/m.55252 type:complete len:254 (-) Transcript_16561:404-1165(-)